MPRRSFPASQQGQSVTARSYLAAFVSSPAPVFGSTIHYLLSGSCVIHGILAALSDTLVPR